ncbi:MAG: hypothetical protein WC831_02530 [Parcubacteria group bacterium]|jgi:hypothetical protein
MQKKIFLMPVLLALVFFACQRQAKADTWTQKYLVDEATSKSLYATDGAQDSSGNKWFTTGSLTGDPNNNRLFEYTAGGTWVDHTDTVNNLIPHPTEKAKSIVYGDKSGNVWLLGGASLLEYDGSNWSRISDTGLSQQLYGDNKGGFFFNIFGDASGNLYAIAQFTGNKAVIKRDANGTWSKVFTGGLIFEDTSSIGSLRGGYNEITEDFWFIPSNSSSNSLSGVYRYSDGDWTHYTTADGLADNSPNSFLVGANGNVWVIFDNTLIDTSTKGISKFDGSSWTTINPSNSGLATGIGKQMSEDNEGRIWFTSIKGDYDGGVVSVFNPSSGSWMYYSARNGLDGFKSIGRVFFLGKDTWTAAGNGVDGFYIIEDNTLYATLYGQVGGATVEEASLGALKKAKSKKVTIYKMTQKKNKKWKAKVYRRTKTSSGWYKSLNLPVGRYKVKVQGKSTKTVVLTDGNPYRLNF